MWALLDVCVAVPAVVLFHPSLSHISQDDNESSFWDDGKSRRTEQRGSELDECTFRPQIRPLPEYYGSQKQLDSVPFEQRVRQWNQHREAVLQRQREKEDNKEVRAQRRSLLAVFGDLCPVLPCAIVH